MAWAEEDKFLQSRHHLASGFRGRFGPAVSIACEFKTEWLTPPQEAQTAIRALCYKEDTPFVVSARAKLRQNLGDFVQINCEIRFGFRTNWPEPVDNRILSFFPKNELE